MLHYDKISLFLYLELNKRMIRIKLQRKLFSKSKYYFSTVVEAEETPTIEHILGSIT